MATAARLNLETAEAVSLRMTASNETLETGSGKAPSLLGHSRNVVHGHERVVSLVPMMDSARRATSETDESRQPLGVQVKGVRMALVPLVGSLRTDLSGLLVPLRKTTPGVTVCARIRLPSSRHLSPGRVAKHLRPLLGRPQPQRRRCVRNLI